MRYKIGSARSTNQKREHIRELQDYKCELSIPVQRRLKADKSSSTSLVAEHFAFAEKEAMIIPITFAVYSEHTTYLDDLGIIASE